MYCKEINIMLCMPVTKSKLLWLRVICVHCNLQMYVLSSGDGKSSCDYLQKECVMQLIPGWTPCMYVCMVTREQDRLRYSAATNGK